MVVLNDMNNWKWDFVGLFGMGCFWDVHDFWCYLVMQMVARLFQATMWPSVGDDLKLVWEEEEGFDNGYLEFHKSIFHAT